MYEPRRRRAAEERDELADDHLVGALPEIAGTHAGALDQ
jgi:hypothetical protein